ncbi:hypothetical protein EV368DRAFT_35486, partial [Lentinula lateritia]
HPFVISSQEPFLVSVLQSKNRLSALSWLDSTSGPRHAPQWNCICKINGETKGKGESSTKAEAKNQASKNALEVLLQRESVMTIHINTRTT